MAYIAICFDRSGPEPARLRQEKLRAHLAYIESIHDRLLVAGPFGDADPDECNASVFVYEVGDRQAAESLLHDDPYFQAGIYAEVRIEPFTPAAGTWIGGPSWLR